MLVLTSYSDAERIVGALDAGAIGYLLKDAEPDEVLRGIRAVGRGESPIHPRAARELLGARAYGAAAGATSPPGRPRCWRWCGRAWRTSRSPAGSGISERTVKAHLTSAFQRIGVVDRTQAALWAERNGLG